MTIRFKWQSFLVGIVAAAITGALAGVLGTPTWGWVLGWVGGCIYCMVADFIYLSEEGKSRDQNYP